MELLIKVAVLGLCLGAVFAEVEIEPVFSDKENSRIVLEVRKDAKNDIICNVTGSSDFEVVWKLNNTLLSEIPALKDIYSFPEREGFQKTEILRFSEYKDILVGNYSCSVDDKSAEFNVISKLKVKMNANTNVVESEKLRIHCIITGRPVDRVVWSFENNTNVNKSDGRYELLEDLENGVPNAILLIRDAQMSDRGEYSCTVSGPGLADDFTVKTMVRVKDKYAALWPFLGICAEVFVLCAIILIYEKKRNKAELEESDTDQSPDQKQTPDHGKDSNLRHRQ